MKKLDFNVTGMSCSSCSANIEKNISNMNGVIEVSVNLLKETLSVSLDENLVGATDIVDKVKSIGYGASLREEEGSPSPEENKSLNDLNTMKKRVLVSFIFSTPLLYLAMGEMLQWPLPKFLSGESSSGQMVLTQLLLILPVLFVNISYFQVGFKGLYKKAPNMDSLVAIGSGAAVIYSLFSIYKVLWALGLGNSELAYDYSLNLYLESAGVILTLITLGKFLESKAKAKTSSAITKLMALAPETALVLRNGKEETIPIDKVVLNETIIVKPGTSIPLDGVIIEGVSFIDESAITGESLPVEKTVNDTIIGGTINNAGYFKMKVTAIGNDTTLSKIIALVDEATSSKAPIARLADKISHFFVPIVIVIAVLATVLWLLLGYNVEFALSIGISILVISCPCALGLATPTAIMVGTGLGAANGILIKSAEALEITQEIDTVVLDKTGTITEGKPEITDIYSLSSEKDLISIGASLENKSEHPLALPLLLKAKKMNISIQEVSDFRILPGKGIEGKINNVTYFAGNRKLMEFIDVDISSLLEKEDTFNQEGKTALYFASKDTLLGIIAVADTLKETSNEAILKLKSMGIDVIMLTGDTFTTAKAIGRKVNIDHIIAEVLPEEKELQIRKLQENGKKVAMVGDGINDAPSLARANVGIAIGAGTDIAIESADLVLMKSNLLDVASAINLSKKVLRNIRQNLFWAFIYNLIGIPVAAGILYSFTGILLNPMIAAAAMSFSSISVVLNALRLRLSFKNKFH